MPAIIVDARSLHAFAKQLAAIEPKLRVLLRREMVKAGGDAADAIRKQADWSSRIPAAVRVKVSFAARGAGVSVVVDRKKAPEGRVLENRGKTGKFRHPVHADPAKPRDQWHWVEQDAQPFFEKGATDFERGEFQGQVEEIGAEVSVMVVRLT